MRTGQCVHLSSVSQRVCEYLLVEGISSLAPEVVTCVVTVINFVGCDLPGGNLPYFVDTPHSRWSILNYSFVV